MILNKTLKLKKLVERTDGDRSRYSSGCSVRHHCARSSEVDEVSSSILWSVVDVDRQIRCTCAFAQVGLSWLSRAAGSWRVIIRKVLRFADRASSNRVESKCLG